MMITQLIDYSYRYFSETLWRRTTCWTQPRFCSGDYLFKCHVAIGAGIDEYENIDAPPRYNNEV
jgi:hypothetical protein